MNAVFLQVRDKQLRFRLDSQQLESSFEAPLKADDSDASAVEAYGKALYQASFAKFPQVLSAEQATQVFVDDPTNAHWELLHDGTNFLALTTLSIIYYSQTATPPHFSLSHAPLRLLYTRLASAGTDEEERLKDFAQRSEGRVELTILRNPSRLRLNQVLDEAQTNQKPFHLWHYSGELVNTSLVFADNNTLNLAQLEKLLQNYPDLRLLILNLHNSGIAGTGFTQLPIASVFAPKNPMPAELQASFLDNWYQSFLVEGLASATRKARQKSYQFSFGENSAWANFALYSRCQEDFIFAPKTSKPKPVELLRDQVFVSYSHQDAAWCQRLMGYLDPLRQSHVLKAWVDTDIEAGSDWYSSIMNALARTKVAVLLASPAFFRSSFIREEELPILLAARQIGQCTVIWVAVSAFTYELTALNPIQAVHPPNEPLDRLSNTAAEDVFLKIARLVAAALKES